MILLKIVRGLSFLVQLLEGDALWHGRCAMSVRLRQARAYLVLKLVFKL